MSDPNPNIQVKQVPQKYIVLRAPRKEWGKPGDGYHRLMEAEFVEIPLDAVLDFYEYCNYHDRYFDTYFLGFGYRAGHAIEEAGWGTASNRGGYWVTDKFTAWMEEKGLV